MKNFLLPVFLLLSAPVLVQAQTKDWINLDPPQSGIVGKLVKKGVMIGNQISPELLETVTGPDIYRQEATRHFTINLPISKFETSKFSRVSVDGMLVDYLSDAAMFGNPDYETNDFVYKALRAKSVTYYFSTKNETSIKLDEVIPKNALTKIIEIIPNANIANITPSRIAKDTVSITITNPRVYFKALAIKLTPNCKNCRQAFKTSKGDNTDYILDLADLSTTSSVIKVPFGTSPMFKLFVDQDPINTAKLKLFLDIDREFLRANHDLITSPIEVPYKELMLNGKAVRRFTFMPLEYYLGTISSNTTRIIWSDVDLHQPIYVSVAAEQIDATKVKIMTRYNGSTFATKIEYTPYKYTLYKGKLL